MATNSKYKTDVTSQNDYFPFGMLLPNRHEAGNEYRYGFNGMEKDDEITGVEGSHLDFGARIYDARVGRWLSVDALEGKFPSVSPYVFTMNNPIYLIDPDGNEPKPGTKTVTTSQRMFLKKVGIKAYKRAREKGLSVHGSLIFLSFSCSK